MTAVQGPAVSGQVVPGRAAPECPYVGLEPFDEEDAEYFFGREHDSELIVDNLIASRLTLLYGPSGVGKSSVLRAAVLPALRHIDDGSYADLGAPGAAVAYVSAWGDTPLKSIAAEVSAAVSQVTGANALEDTAQEPSLSVPWLRKVLRQSRVSEVYLILDQFEEYFFYHPTDRGEEGLVAELGRILSAGDLPVHVLLSIREDAFASIDRFKGRVPYLFDNYLRLAHLSRDAAQAAIKGPLNRYNRVAPPGQTMSIESGLIDILLDQVRTGHEQETALNGVVAPASDDRGDIEAPFLQLVLTTLWTREQATGSWSLRQRTLDDLGGAQTIVQSHLDNVMADLSSEQVSVAAAVFSHLVTKSGTKIALTTEDLAERSGLPANAVQELLETLCAGPRRILRPVGITEPRRYEIFHDVLGPAVLDWRRRYVAQQQQEEASRRLSAEREKARTAVLIARRRLRQRFAAGLAVMLLVVGVLGVFAYQAHRNEQQQTLLTQAATALSYNPTQSLQYAVEAYNLQANGSARSAVLEAASSPRSRVVAGPGVMPDPMMVIGMKVTPDSRQVVAYDAQGNVQVMDDAGAVERRVAVPGLRGVSPQALAADVSPDASYVALGTDQGRVAVINTVTGRHIDIGSGEGLPRVVRWIGSAGNGRVLVVSGSGVAATYSPETGEQAVRVPGEVFDALPLADEHIVTSGPDHKLRVWDARTAAVTAESPTLDPGAVLLKRYSQSVVSPSVVSLTVGAPSSIVVWNWQAGTTPVRFPVEDLNDLQDLVVNEHAGTVLIVQGKKVWTYSLADGSLLGSLPRQGDFVNAVATSPDAQWVTTGSADGRVLAWFLGNRQSPTDPTYAFLGHRGAVIGVSSLRAGTVVMSLGLDGTLQRWELPQVPRFGGHTGWVSHLDLSPQGKWLATASQDGHAFIIDPHNLLAAPVATVPAGIPLRVVLFDPAHPDHILTLGRSERAPALWRWSGGGTPAEPLPVTYAIPPLPAFGYLVSLAISPDGTTLAGGDNGGAVHLWDAATGALRADFPGSGQPAGGVAFDPAGQLLAATDSGGVRLWKLGTTGPPTLLPHPHATKVTFDPAGHHLASTDLDGTVKIWTREGKFDRELVAHGLLSSPSFSSDGRLLAVGTAAGMVEVWDVGTGVTVLLDLHHSASVNAVKFLPGDDSRLISASDDTTVAQFSCPACTDPDRVIQDAVQAHP